VAVSASGAWILASGLAIALTISVREVMPADRRRSWRRQRQGRHEGMPSDAMNSTMRVDQLLISPAVARRLVSSSYWNWNFGAFLFSRVRFDNFH
jgi:hypothetical protein